METDFFATMLVPPFRPAPDWAESLAANLLHPQFTISLREALGRRLRRNYVWIYLILATAWALKLWLHPEPAPDVAELVRRAALGGVTGGVVVAAVIAATLAVVVFSLATMSLQQASGEVVPRFGSDPKRSTMGVGSWFRASRRRQEFLALIITDRADDVSAAVLDQMKRGVTALEGRGMYTKGARTVLMSAITVTEIPAVRALVKQIDPDAFVIVTPAHGVYGEGFAPLDAEG
jgi:hypothetical protein